METLVIVQYRVAMELKLLTENAYVVMLETKAVLVPQQWKEFAI